MLLSQVLLLALALLMLMLMLMLLVLVLLPAFLREPGWPLAVSPALALPQRRLHRPVQGLRAACEEAWRMCCGAVVYAADVRRGEQAELLSACVNLRALLLFFFSVLEKEFI